MAPGPRVARRPAMKNGAQDQDQPKKPGESPSSKPPSSKPPSSKQPSSKPPSSKPPSSKPSGSQQARGTAEPGQHTADRSGGSGQKQIGGERGGDDNPRDASDRGGSHH
jgi:hypothetical protein